MYGSSKPNYVAFALLLVVLMTLVVLIIPMRPSNWERLSKKEVPTDTISTIIEDTIPLDPTPVLDTFSAVLDTVAIDSTGAIIAVEDSIAIADTPSITVVPPTIIKEEPLPQKAEEKVVVVPQADFESSGLGKLLLTVLMLLILGYAVFRLVTRRWEYKEEQALNAKFNMKRPVARASYNPSGDWAFDVIEPQTSTTSTQKTKKIDKKAKVDTSTLKTSQPIQTKTQTAKTQTTTKQATKPVIPSWIKELVLTPFIIIKGILLGIVTMFLSIAGLFSQRASIWKSGIVSHIDLYGIDVPSTITLVLFAWVQYLMFPTFPFHGAVLVGLMIFPVVYIPLYTLPTLYRFWQRAEGSLGMWFSAILWNIVLIFTLIIYGLMKLLEGQEDTGGSGNLWIGVAVLAGLYLVRRWYKGRQVKAAAAAQIAKTIDPALLAQQEEERKAKQAKFVGQLKLLVSIVIGGALLVFMFDDSLTQKLGLDEEIRNMVMGGVLLFVVLTIAYFSSNGNKNTKTTIDLDASDDFLDEDVLVEEDFVEPEDLVVADEKIQTIQFIDPAVFDEPEWWLNVDLERLGMIDMSYKDLDEDHPFMPYLMDCINLKVLYLNGNNFEAIPFEVFELEALNVLELKDNKIAEIHTDIEFLEELKILELEDNKITELPVELQSAANLKLLALNNNPISLKNIDAFKVARPDVQVEHNSKAVQKALDTKVEELKKDGTNAKDLTKIKRLLKKKLANPNLVHHINELYHEGISTLPNSIFEQFNNLRGIHLQGNMFKQIPNVLYKLPVLRNLYLDNNQITRIPDEIIAFQELRTLSLNKNSLAKVSMNITKLPNLRRLYMEYAELQEFPVWATQIQELKELDLCGNNIKKIPYQITELKNLEELNISFANMIEIPDYLCSMPLQVLNWAGNGLTKFPENFTNLISLRELNISHNPDLKLDGTVLKELPFLRVLRLGGMEFNWIPKFIPEIKGLSALWLNDNNISKLPYNFDELKQLKTLSLSRNQFTELPESISLLSELKELYLDHNQLTALPESIKNLKKLQRLSIQNNLLTLSAKRDLQKWLPNTRIDY
ncbi:MAG: leucine-rich repeat domain-containing protein [Aureispira sp.]|nr:leucine-rich repeat domain-containing protein [Aureispira sp.]